MGDEVEYLQRTVGDALQTCVAHTIEADAVDPIEHLALTLKAYARSQCS